MKFKKKNQHPQKSVEKVIVKIRGWREKEWRVSKSKKLFEKENEESWLSYSIEELGTGLLSILAYFLLLWPKATWEESLSFSL